MSSLTLFGSSMTTFEFDLLETVLFNVHGPMGGKVLMLDRGLIFLMLQSPCMLSTYGTQPGLGS